MKLLSYDARQIRRKGATGVFDLRHTRDVVAEVFADEFHAQQVMSLGNAVGGALKAAGAGIHAIGAGYAELAHVSPKHGVKQVDRLLSNGKVRLDDCLSAWCRFAVGEHPSIVIALDWTEFERDSHSSGGPSPERTSRETRAESSRNSSRTFTHGCRRILRSPCLLIVVSRRWTC